MKNYFIFCLCLLTASISYADGIDLLNYPPEGEAPPDNRGQVLIPTVDYTNGEVTIFMPYQIDDVEVTISDNQGEVLYSTVIPVINQQHSIVLSDNVDANKYSIQIAYDDIHLIGFF